jgi:UDP-N-acetylglucosamine 2-epimerase (non-hydrolysing)
MPRVLCLFGTRPEIIKLSPVLEALAGRRDRIETIHVSSSQHQELLQPFARSFGVRIDHDLAVMKEDQSPADVASRVLAALDPLLEHEAPDLVIVQGDTTTAMSGALAANLRGIPVGHVEAGLRTGDLANPFPEEMNRRLVTRMAALHFAPTRENVRNLLSEGVPAHRIALTGNPVVDAVQAIRARSTPSPDLERLLAELPGRRLVVVTTHRRESFGAVMEENLRVLRRFVERHPDVGLAFPVHPNPRVREAAQRALGGVPRVHLIEPLGYADFVHLLGAAWLVVSDSGGVQEEAPSLGVPLLVLREKTERPEAIEAGVARLVGGRPERLEALLEELAGDDSWIRSVQEIPNPYGEGDSGERIADAIEAFLLDRALPSEAGSAVPEPRALADFVGEALAHVKEIPTEEAHRVLAAPNREGWHFVDVREPDEYADGHVPGARSSPRGFLEVRADLDHYKRDAWFEDRARKLILYCGGGHRSALAARTLREMGFSHVVSMAEGWTGWTERGYPVER